VIEQGIVDGQLATLAYVNDDIESVDKADATMVIASLEDGRKLFLNMPGVFRDKGKGWDESEHPRDEEGKFTAGGGGLSTPQVFKKAARMAAAGQVKEARALIEHERQHRQVSERAERALAKQYAYPPAHWAVEEREAWERGAAALARERPPTEPKKKGPAKPEDFQKAGITFRSLTGSEEDAAALWNKHIGMDPAEFKTAFLGGQGGTMTVQGNPRQEEFVVSGYIAGEGKFKGEMIANYQRELNFKTKKAYSALFEVREAAQKEGVGKKLLAGNIEMYEKLGIESVGVSAGLKRGAYAWAKYGYVPTQESWDDLRRDLQYDIGAGGSRYTGNRATDTMEADDWSMLSSDQQDEVYRQWRNDSRNEFLENEIDSWRNSGEPLEQAKRNAAEKFNDRDDQSWAEDAVEELRETNKIEGERDFPFSDAQILNAIELDYDSRYSDGNGDLTITWDDSKLSHPAGYDPSQITMEGVGRLEPHEYLTKEMRERIETRLSFAFDKEGREKEDDIEPPDMGDQVEEYMESHWESIDDDERLRIAVRLDLQNITITVDEEEEVDADSSDPVAAILADRNPKAIWKLADTGRGKELLFRKSWSGTLNLKDPESYKRFKDYVGRVKK